jgi:hypothetical protein
LHDDRGLAVTEILGVELIIRGVRHDLVMQHGRAGWYQLAQTYLDVGSIKIPER